MLEIFWLLFDARANEIIRYSLPGIMVEMLEILTHLGEGAFLFGIAAILYWVSRDESRENRILILALAVATLSLVMGLKGLLQVPRPVGELAFAPENYPGWSTPSAHAMGATAVYGGYAALKEKGYPIIRYIIAGLIILIVALSRVVIGVHYLGDVILGVLLGILLVYIGLKVKNNGSITYMFVIAFFISVGAYLLGSKEFITLSLGSSIGGMISWKLVEHKPTDPRGGSILLSGMILFPFVVLFWVLESLILIRTGLDTIEVLGIPFLSLFSIIGYAVLFGIVVALPNIATKINHWNSVKKLEEKLPVENDVPKRERNNPY